jgi:hypothetical protein
LKGEVVERFNKDGDHYGNFLSAVRNNKASELNADILEGHLSSALCHLGNISYRLGTPVTGIEASERLASDKEGLETFQRVSEHLAANMVMIEHAKLLHFGKKLAIDPTSEVFTGSDSADADAMLTRDYRKPFVVPAEKDV